MTTNERIKAILKQKNYQVIKGKVHRYDVLDDKFKPVPAQGNRIPLVKDGSIVEVFLLSDVMGVVDAMQQNGKLPEKEQSVQEYADSLPIQVVEDVPVIVFGEDMEKWKNTYDKSVPAGIEQYGTIPKAKKKVKKEKSVQPKSEIVSKLKKVVEKIQKKKPVKKVKAAPKKASTRKPYPTGKDRASLSEKDMQFIKDNYKTMSINKIALKFGVGRLTVGHHVRKLKNGKK